MDGCSDHVNFYPFRLRMDYLGDSRGTVGMYVVVLFSIRLQIRSQATTCSVGPEVVIMIVIMTVV